MALVSMLLRRGFYVVRQEGSHVHLQHTIYKYLRVTVPMSKKDLPIKTLKTILKQSNIPWNEFEKMLGR